MTYSADFGAQVIKSVEHQGMSIRQVYVFYDISKATLQNRLKDPSIKLTRNKSPRIAQQACPSPFISSTLQS